MIKKQNNGFSPILIILLLAIIFIIVCAGAFYLLKSKGMLPGYGTQTPVLNNLDNLTVPVASPMGGTVSPAPVSDRDDNATLQMELDYTDEGTIDTQLQELESSASSL